jgi:two-component system NarL family sensor kinase
MEDKIELGITVGWATMFILVMVIIVFTQHYRRKMLYIEAQRQISAFSAYIEGEENLKEKISYNLHDEIIPLLTVIAQNIRRYKKITEGNSQNFDFNTDYKLIEQAIQGTRAITLDLIPTTFLNYGLIKAIEQRVELLNMSDLFVELDTKNLPNTEIPFRKSEQINIYRICMELINNLVKHSCFTFLRIKIQYNSELFLMQFEHDGKPITNEEIKHLSQTSQGLGLKSLNSRLLILKGSIDYSIEGEIPKIVLTIPYTP